MSADLLLVHGDDGLGLGMALDDFAARLGVPDRTELVPERSPDEAILDRAGVESASVGLFGPHLVVLRQPLKAAGRSAALGEKLLDLVRKLPEGAALALAEERPSRDIGKPPALLAQLAQAVRDRDGEVAERLAPRRNELGGWTVRHAAAIGVAIEPRAATILSQRVGGAVWESDVERGEQTRIVDSELRKLRTHAGERPISVSDVEALTTDARPASVFAITNAVDRREPAAAAAALERALAEDQPVLRIMASLAGRISDLIVARELSKGGASPAELTRRVGRGNARVAERVVEAAGRYRADELEAMLRGLFEADLAVKANEIEPEAAITAWLGEYLLAGTRSAGRQVRSGGAAVRR
jgi:DNA polymerase III delta subunit